jgi:HNH endonuclease.
MYYVIRNGQRMQSNQLYTSDLVLTKSRGFVPVTSLLPRKSPDLETVVESVVKGALIAGGLAFSLECLRSLFEKPKTRRKAGPASVPIVEVDELSIVEWIFYRTGGRCFYCSKQLCLSNRGWHGGRGAWEADHFIPFSRRGSDQPYNLVAACVRCNRAKSNLHPWEFMPYRFAKGDRNPNKYI